MYDIPERFREFTTALHGDEGQAWLDRLPTILDRCARRWELTLEAPFANLSYHYAAPATRADGQRVVIKACSPTREYLREAAALRLFAGEGIAQLLASDDDDEVMLLERLEPGTLLSSLEDDTEATTIAATVMRQLWRPAPEMHTFPTVADWGNGLVKLRARYDGNTGPFPATLVNEAETLYTELMASAPAPMLLHGDLHHENILAAERASWLAIDPKGLVGDPAYEVGALLMNPIPGLLRRPDPRRVIAQRVDQLASELGIDRTRIRGWGLYRAVLSAWWDVEDLGVPSEHALTCATLLAAV